ncbi:MAG: M67 family metallopeptidase [Acidimicrobiia bacterium]
MLFVPPEVLTEMVAHAFDGLPNEACGLLIGNPATSEVSSFYPTANAANSSKVYTVAPLDHLKADRVAEEQGLEIIGVMHSHTHTTAYPSPTDVAQAPDPGWHYLIVSLRESEPALRSYRIEEGIITEEEIRPQPR